MGLASSAQVVFQWLVESLLMALVLVCLVKSSARAQSKAVAGSLHHPKILLVLALVVLIVFGTLAILSATMANKQEAMLGALCFLGFASLSLPLFAEYHFAHHRLTEEALFHGSLLGRRGELRWSDVRQVEYAKAMKWFKLRASSGKTVRISALLVGLPEFARCVLAHVPTDCMDVETLEVLQSTARGKPPSFWG